MARRYAVGDRVDGLYDGNSDDVWYPGVITAAQAEGDSYDLLYDDGEIEQSVASEFVRVHEPGTICAGSRVFGRYAGGDEWYAGKIHEVQDDGTFTIEYDDGEVEASVIMAYIRETLVVAGVDGEGDEEAASQDEEGGGEDKATAERTEVDAPVESPDVGEAKATEEDAANEEEEEEEAEEETPSLNQEATPAKEAVVVPSETEEAPTRSTSPSNNGGERTQDHKSSEVEAPLPLPNVPVQSGVVDEYASIASTVETLETARGDPLVAKTLLSTLVKQMRALPQATADVVHARNGEALLVDVLTRHHSHAVIQCYAFVLLRRLCFLCGKSTHYFLRHGIVELVAIAMRKFPEDAILQASACGALAVFTRVHAGLAALLANRVSHLVLATIIFHKAYSVHTRQVHYYACEVLLELCELGDTATVEALCGGDALGSQGPGLSDLSPVSLLLFLLRQALTSDDKKACCAVGTLLLCLASCHRHAAQMVVDLQGLTELSNVMAKFPKELGIQKYAASASKAIAMCSMDTTAPASSPSRRAQHLMLSDSTSTEDLYKQRHPLPRRSGGKIVGGSKSSSSAKRKAPPSQRSGLHQLPSYVASSHHQQAREPASFSKYTSPLGKAPHLPTNFRAFGETSIGAASPSAASMAAFDHNQMASPPMRRDSRVSDRKAKFPNDERTQVLFETYGVDAHKALLPSHGNTNESHGRMHQGIKRRQLRTHIVSASASSGSEQISWASPVKSIILPSDMKPLSSRSGDTKATPGEKRKVRTSGGEATNVSIDREADEYSTASLRRQQAPPVAAKAKKKERDEKTPRSASFQLKLDQSRPSNGTSSPTALSPKTGRSGVSSSRAKAASTKSTSDARTTRATKTNGVGSSESLNTYAAQLFKDELETTANSASSTRVTAQAHERERLSFAEKLHKMIDKAKSSLGQCSTVSLASEMHVSPVKSTTAQRQAAKKKKQAPVPVPVVTSRIAPASIKPASDTATASVSTPNVTLPKKPPVAVARPTSVRKPIATSVASTSKPIAPPKNVKPTGSAVSRPTPSTPMKPTSASARPGSTKKPTSGSKTPKASGTASVAVAVTSTASVAAAAAVVATGAATESAHESLRNDADNSVNAPVSAETLSPAPPDDMPKEESGASVDASPDSSGQIENAPALEEVVDPTTTLPTSDEVVSEDTIPESGNDAPTAAEEEKSASTEGEPSTSQTDSPPPPTDVERVIDEAATVVASAAVELYADEYNDFDDLDNAPQTPDDDDDDQGSEAKAEMGRKVSFEALMNLTAQVTEFTVATETPQDETTAGPDTQEVDVDLETPVVATDVADETDTNVSSPLDGESDERVQVPTAPPMEEKDSPDNGQPTEESSEQTVSEAQGLEFFATTQSKETSQEPDAVATAPNDMVAADSANSEPTPEAQEDAPDNCKLESSPRASDEGVRVADEEGESVPFPPDTDRPESRGTEASYADEDFDDAPENDEDEAADLDAALDEATRDVEPFETMTFASAELPTVEAAYAIPQSKEIDTAANATDERMDVEADVSQSHSEGCKEETETVIIPDNEDDYGDSDYAGDASLAADTEQGEGAQDDATTSEYDSSAAVTGDSDAVAECADLSVEAEAEVAVLAGSSEITAEGTTGSDVHPALEDAVAVEANGVAAEEPSTTEQEAPTTPVVVDTTPQDEAQANTEQFVDPTATAILIMAAEDEMDKSTPGSDESSDGYGDAEFDADTAMGTKEEAVDPVSEMQGLHAEIDSCVERVSVEEDEKHAEDSVTPAADLTTVLYTGMSAADTLADEAMTDEPSAAEYSEAATLDTDTPRADTAVPDSAFNEGGADSESLAAPTVTAIATDDSPSALSVGDEGASQSAEDTSDCGVSAATEELVPQVSLAEAELAAENPSPADDDETGDASPENDSARDVEVEQQANAQVEAESEQVIASVNARDGVTKDACDLETPKDSDEVYASMLEPPLEDASAIVVVKDPDASSPDGDNEPIASTREALDTLNQEGEEAPPLAEVQERPATAMAYDDDDFDSETPRNVERPGEETSDCEVPTAYEPQSEISSAEVEDAAETPSPVNDDDGQDTRARDEIARDLTLGAEVPVESEIAETAVAPDSGAATMGAPEMEDNIEADASMLESSPEDTPAFVDMVDPDACSSDGENGTLVSAEEGDGTLVQEREEALVQADDSQRPATAMAYDDEDFDGESPRDVEKNGDETAVSDDPVTDGGDATENTAEPATSHEAEALQSLSELDTARPNTADAYDGDAEFEDGAAMEDFERPTEVPVPADAAIENVVSATPSDESDGSVEQEEYVEPPSDSQTENQPPQECDGIDVESPTELETSNETDAAHENGVTHEEAEAPSPLAGPTFVAAEDDEPAVLEARPATPVGSAVYEDETMADEVVEATDASESLTACESSGDAVEQLEADNGPPVNEEAVDGVDIVTSSETPPADIEVAVPDELAPVVAGTLSAVEVEADQTAVIDDTTAGTETAPEDHVDHQAPESDLNEEVNTVEADDPLLHETPADVSEPRAPDGADPASDSEAANTVDPADAPSSDVAADVTPSPLGLEEDQPDEGVPEARTEELPTQDSVDASSPESAPVSEEEVDLDSEQPSAEAPAETETPGRLDDQSAAEPEERATEPTPNEVSEGYAGDELDKVADEVPAPKVEMSEPEDDGPSLDDKPSLRQETSTLPVENAGEASTLVEEPLAEIAGDETSGPVDELGEHDLVHDQDEREPAETEFTRDQEEEEGENVLAASAKAATADVKSSPGEETVGEAPAGEQEALYEADATGVPEEDSAREATEATPADTEAPSEAEVANDPIADEAAPPESPTPAEPPESPPTTEDAIESTAVQELKNEAAQAPTEPLAELPQIVSEMQKEEEAQIESAPSPVSDDVEYDEFEADEPSPPSPSAAAEKESVTEEAPAEEKDEATAYAADDDAYNEFEEDDEAVVATTAAKPIDDGADEAYDMDEAFENDDDKPPARIPPTIALPPGSSPLSSSTNTVAQSQPRPPTPAVEDDGDYEAEYDDFED